MSIFKEIIYETYSSAKLHKTGNIATVSDIAYWSKHTYERIKGFLSEDKTIAVLDLATGTGNFLYMLYSKGYKNLAGVDISLEQIDTAKRIIPEADLFNTDIFDYLKDKENRFDLISGFDIIEHFTRQEAYELMLLVNKALKPNGRIILQTPNAYSLWSGAVCYGDLTHEWFYTPNSLDDLLIQCGFHQYTAVEAGPLPIGLKGIIRTILWKLLKVFYKLSNAIEIGIAGKNIIFSRVFIATAVKK